MKITRRNFLSTGAAADTPVRCCRINPGLARPARILWI